MPLEAFSVAVAIMAGNSRKMTFKDERLSVEAEGWSLDEKTNTINVHGPQGLLDSVAVSTMNGKTEVRPSTKKFSRAWIAILHTLANEFGGELQEENGETLTLQGRPVRENYHPQDAMYERIHEFRTEPPYVLDEALPSGGLVVGDIVADTKGVHKGRRGILFSLHQGPRVAYPDGTTGSPYDVKDLILVP